MSKPQAKDPWRPTKYRPDFHIDEFIRLSKLGMNITQIARDWDLHRDTIYEWASKHRRFSDAVKKGKMFAEAWYIDRGREAMLENPKASNFNVGVFVWMTKNIFKWSDRDVMEHREVDRPLKDKTDEELEEMWEKG